MKPLFQRHPLPWKWENEITSCGNGSAIHGIIDAKGECVSSTYNGAAYPLWEMYQVLTDEQKKELGDGIPACKEYNKNFTKEDAKELLFQRVRVDVDWGETFEGVVDTVGEDYFFIIDDFIQNEYVAKVEKINE